MSNMNKVAAFFAMLGVVPCIPVLDYTTFVQFSPEETIGVVHHADAAVEPVEVGALEAPADSIAHMTIEQTVTRVTIGKNIVADKENEAKKNCEDIVAKAFRKSDPKKTVKASSATSNSQTSSPASASPGLPDEVKLTDRKLVGAIAKPKYVGDEDGRIVVDICVDPKGFVIEARYNRKESDIMSVVLIKEAEKAAIKTRFSEAVDNRENQWGTITYYFNIKKYIE